MAESPMAGAKELQELLVGYAKQETIGPLRNLAGFVAKGVAGALLVGIGAFFLGLGTLRLAQSLMGEGAHLLSVVPYLIAVAVVVVVIGLLVAALQRSIKKVNRRV